MRITDDRYAGERRPLELAIRMIGHEARTFTIMTCTGLSDDRIRKLYATYFKAAGELSVKRHRGKSPSCISFFVKSPANQSEATTLAALFAAFELFRIDPQGRIHEPWRRDSLDFGDRFCDVFETYRVLHAAPRISFERAWNLFDALSIRVELVLIVCRRCGNLYVHDALAINERCCPCCKLKAHRRRGSIRPHTLGVKTAVS